MTPGCLLSWPSLVKLSPELTLGESAIGKRLSVQKHARREENPMAHGKRFSFEGVQVKERERKAILDLQAFEHTFGVCAEIALFPGQQKNVQGALTFPGVLF
jgi:hypothetical protein